jgi:PhnB protein
MSNLNIPEGYNAVMPYLIVDNPVGLQQFMTTVLGATLKMHQPNPDGGFGHAEVTIGNSCIMFSQTMQGFAANTAGLFVYVEDADKAYKLALESGATSIMPPTDQPYGRSSGVKDPFCNTWWITSAK